MHKRFIRVFRVRGRDEHVLWIVVKGLTKGHPHWILSCDIFSKMAADHVTFLCVLGFALAICLHAFTATEFGVDVPSSASFFLSFSFSRTGSFHPNDVSTYCAESLSVRILCSCSFIHKSFAEISVSLHLYTQIVPRHVKLEVGLLGYNCRLNTLIQ